MVIRICPACKMAFYTPIDGDTVSSHHCGYYLCSGVDSTAAPRRDSDRDQPGECLNESWLSCYLF